MIYVLMFILSMLCFFISTKIKKNRILHYASVLCGITLPCLMASLRGLSVGTDVSVYVEPLYVASKRFDNFFDYYNFMISVKDVLYLLTTYIFSHIFSTHYPLYFVLELLVIMPLYITLKRANNDKALLFGLFLFFMTWYNQSLNMVRQSIAISFSILSLSYLSEKFNYKVVLTFLIAYMFHSSAFIMIPIYILFYLFDSNKKNAKKRDFLRVSVTLVIITCLAFFPELFKMLNKIGLVTNAKYTTYAVDYLRGKFNFSFIKTFIYIYIFYILKVYSSNENNKEKNFYTYLAFISIFILQIGGMIKFAERISFYFFYPALFCSLPIVMYNKNATKGKFLVFNYFIFIVYFIYWILYLNYDSTLPYIMF